MTYNFDPERWFDIEATALEKSLRDGALDRDAYEAALALEPEFASAHWNLALTYLELERFVEAKDHFEIYLELKPEAAVEVKPYLDDLREVVP